MIKRNCLLVAVLLTAFFLAGCKTVYTGPDMQTQAVYSWGTLKATESRPIAVVNAAALKAMDDLGLTVTMKTADSLSGRIVARDSQDNKITVTLTALTENSTKVVIQAGPLGNEDKSRMVFKQIQTNLAMGK
jgi:predicted small secreted protein